jgi:hypothetical protein
VERAEEVEVKEAAVRFVETVAVLYGTGPVDCEMSEELGVDGEGFDEFEEEGADAEGGGNDFGVDFACSFERKSSSVRSSEGRKKALVD